MERRVPGGRHHGPAEQRQEHAAEPRLRRAIRRDERGLGEVADDEGRVAVARGERRRRRGGPDARHGPRGDRRTRARRGRHRVREADRAVRDGRRGRAPGEHVVQRHRERSREREAAPEDDLPGQPQGVQPEENHATFRHPRQIQDAAGDARG
eukprot:6259-Pelagococcus_subviridis.AAC.1